MLNWERERWELVAFAIPRTFTDGIALQNNTELDSATNKRPRLSEAIACPWKVLADFLVWLLNAESPDIILD